VTPSGPLVSVLISTYNRSSFLEKAIASAIAQSYSNLEIIVVNDGSTDETEDVCGRFGDRLRYVRQDNAGLGFARERALQLAQGQVFVWLDDDDRWAPQKVERVVDHLERDRDKPWVHSDAIEVDPQGKIIHESYLEQFSKLNLKMEGQVFEEMLVTCFPLSSTVAMRRECLRKLGGFFTSESYGVDLDLYTRASIFFSLGLVREPLVYRTMHRPNDARTNSVYISEIRFGCRIPVFRRILEGDYPLTPAQRRRVREMLGFYHFKTGEAYFSAGQPSRAGYHFRRSLLHGSHRLRSCYGAARCLIQSPIVSLRSKDQSQAAE